MATPGFTPIDETVSPKGFTPIDETTTPQAQATPAVARPPVPPGSSTVSAYTPTIWERIRQALPIIDRVQTGLSPAATTTAEAVAKPLPGMSDERAVAPEQLMTPTEQQRHPIATGAGQFAGGMTTPENLLLSTMMGQNYGAITRAANIVFGTQMLKGAAEQLPDLKDALVRKDIPEVERIATHILLGSTFGLSAGKHGVTGESGMPVYTELRNRGQAITDYIRRAKSLNEVNKAATLLYGSKIQEPLSTLQARLKDDGVASLAPALAADKTAPKPMVPGTALAEVHKSLVETGYEPKPAERALLDKLSADPSDDIAKSLGFPNAAVAEVRLGSTVWESTKNNPQLASAFQSKGLTLDDALKLRTSLGSAAARAEKGGNAKGGKVLWTAYNQLGEVIGDRVQELTGNRKAFDDYNKNFKAAFELNKGFTGDLMDPLTDPHEAKGKLKTFSDADLSQVVDKYMKPKGIDPRPLLQAQRDAKSLVAAHDAISGKLAKGLYRQVMTDTPGEALIPMGAYMAAKGAGLYGFAPYLLATIAGKVAGAASRETEAGRILRKLDIPINQKYLNLRTEVPPSPEPPVGGPSGGPPVGSGGGPTPIRPNASGESSASLEAISREKANKIRGVKTVRIDSRSGKEFPLVGVDAADAKAGPYDVIVQRGPQGEIELDRGVKAGRLAKVRAAK